MPFRLYLGVHWFRLYLGVHWRYFPENSCATNSARAGVIDQKLSTRTLHEELCVFSNVSRIYLEGLPLKFMPHTLHACATNDVSLVAFGQSLGALY